MIINKKYYYIDSRDKIPCTAKEVIIETQQECKLFPELTLIKMKYRSAGQK